MKHANKLAHKGIKTIKVGDTPLVKGACLLPFFYLIELSQVHNKHIFKQLSFLLSVAEGGEHP